MVKQYQNYRFFLIIILYILILIIFVDKHALGKQFSHNKQKASSVKKQIIREELIGGIINKSDLKIGFLNNGRFCPPEEFIPDLPGGLFEELGYVGTLDLWIGIPDGPWAPKVWNVDSQKYISKGPTVSGTNFEYLPANITDWSTVNATEGVLYSYNVRYSNIYEPSKYFDFILTPTSNIEQSWPKDPLTGFRNWPGCWKKDPLTGKPIKGVFFGDQDVFVSFDDKINSYQNGGYPICAEVLGQATCFQDAYISNIVIFDLQIINTSNWDYHDSYLGIYYSAAHPWYYLTTSPLRSPFLKTAYIKNEYDTKLNDVIPYNLSYSYNFGNSYTNLMFLGVQFLKTPLAEKDNEDNDGDRLVDEQEGEELGLTGWHYITYLSTQQLTNREWLQYRVLAGDTTGLKKMVNYYFFFPDTGSHFNPNFDSPDMIRNPESPFGPGVIYNNLRLRNLMSCGPINWFKGDTLNFVFSILVDENLEKLKASARMARNIVRNNYRYSEGPPAPKVTAVPRDGKVTLYWDRSAETAENLLTGYQDFEGYKIYRTTNDPVNNEWGTAIYDHYGKLINFIPIARCDLVNGIYGYEKVYPFQNLGEDTGIFHTWTDSNVTNGVTYWYSVCSYNHGIVTDSNFNPVGYPRSPMQECPRGTDPERDVNLVKVIPGIQAANFQSPVAEIEQFSDAAGNGTIEPLIIDPYQVTGHDYLISFEDTSYGFAVYDLYDETENKLVIKKVTSTNGQDGVFFDGIQLYVKRYDDMDVMNERTLWYKSDSKERSNCTWSIYGGKLTWDPYPYEYDIRFTTKMDSGVFTKRTAPFEIWNTVLNQKALWDIYWNFAGTDITDSLKNTWSSGDVIYIWDEFNEKNKFTLQIIITEKSVYTYQGLMNIPPQPGDVAHIALKRPFITGDRFRIRTSAMKQQEIAQADLNKIKVVPNPYLVEAGWELGRNESKIQFINLPSECKIHIFTMAGDKVRTLEHNNPHTNYEFWDLLNNSNLKVSYGLYVYVVETPDGKSSTGKFVILR